MARHLFFGDVASWALGLGADETAVSGQAGKHALVIPGGTVTLWTAASGGVQITDLLDALGNPITSVTADSNGQLPQIQGPDTTPDTWYAWADGNGGAGPRIKILATDLADAIGAFNVDHTAFNDLLTLLRGGAVGQMLTPDADPTSEFGVRWGAPPTGGSSGSSPAGYIGVDVTQGPYSADKTGATDVRAVIQAAIDDVSAAGGGIVLLPPGTYGIGAPGLQMKSGVWLRGAGQENTMLVAVGTWASESGIINIGTLSTAANVHNVHVSNLWIKGTPGTAFATTPPSLIDGILLNSGGVTWDSDAVHRFHDLLIWDCDRGLVVYGVDDQAINFVAIRGRHFLRQGLVVGREDGSGGGADDHYAMCDFSSANRGGGTYSGIEVYGTNNAFLATGSWFNKRSTAFVEGQTYKDGAGWYIGGTRNRFFGVEAQDNGGHGFVVKFGKNTFVGATADSSNYIDNISGSAGSYECSGFYIGASASSLTMTGIQAYNRSSTSQLQKRGVTIDAAARNIFLQGTAWDNKSGSSAADPADGVGWVNGAAHSTHEVRVQSSFGSTLLTITNGGTAGASGVVAKRKGSADEVTVTGTTLTSDGQLTATVPGGARYYRVEALIIYRADATDNARMGFATAIVSGSGTVDFHWQPHYTKADATAQNPYVLSQVGTTRYVVVDGDGNVSASGYTNQRSLYIVGHLYVGTSVVNGSVTLQVAADTTAGGTGVRVKENSYLTVTPVTYS
ncbi:glycoside hydrolase family 55 protein [Actinoallomurus purpureus]|uniref:glycoside hydrolase family 55 protein n=1 Tax=Actinoallomurus purpureus TaxID=478114 RepID=UPI002092A663|nr:glycoside hydrolase family 55 protein [Actinoallomurus purpureus]MCO6011405.1 glycoside hydrolase family 55 protein [Actinoallomurus purpureus]